MIPDPINEKRESAYSKSEIDILKNWVQEGGSLLLITDHHPDPPAIADLAKAFGIEVKDGWVLNTAKVKPIGPIYFRRKEGTLKHHPITRGRPGYKEEIDEVVSFTGCAFRAGPHFDPLFIFSPNKVSYFIEDPGQANRYSPGKCRRMVPGRNDEVRKRPAGIFW